MFKRYLIGFVLCWLLAVFILLWGFLNFFPDAQVAYQRLMNFSDEVAKEQLKEEARLTQQTREQVSKQILYKKDLHRLQSRLVSQSSELIFAKKEQGGELVEHFKEVYCVMQEKFIDSENESDPMSLSQNGLQLNQYVRSLKAQDAIYAYKTGQLVAEEVEVAHYVIPGLLWPFSLEAFHPLIQGQAQKLQISMFKEPHLKAVDFKAIFHEWGDEW
jgi:hypothetical protein